MEIGQLTNLDSLFVENNALTELPPEIGQLSNLTQLYLEGNPLTDPPPEVVDRGGEAIRAYYQAQAE